MGVPCFQCNLHKFSLESTNVRHTVTSYISVVHSQGYFLCKLTNHYFHCSSAGGMMMWVGFTTLASYHKNTLTNKHLERCLNLSLLLHWMGLQPPKHTGLMCNLIHSLFSRQGPWQSVRLTPCLPFRLRLPNRPNQLVHYLVPWLTSTLVLDLYWTSLLPLNLIWGSKLMAMAPKQQNTKHST